MEGDSLLIEGSPGTNLHKSSGKGRKKKGALAKLAEKKRLNSDGGSEYGSTVSIQKQIESPKTESVERNVEDKQINISSKHNSSRDNLKDLKEHKVQNNSKEDKKEEKVETVNSEPETRPRIPKPQPRKLNVQRGNKEKEDKILASLEGGTVVSIYDKVDKTPTGTKKKEAYLASRQRNKAKDTANTDEQNPKRELFPHDNKLDSGLSFLGPVKTKPGLSPLGELPALDGDISTDKLKNVQLSPPHPMDIDDDLGAEKDLKNSDLISNNAPSDATVHRFRALRMTPDRCKSEESLRNISFMPKPPSTPRSDRKTSSKGEKRIRETNSSGEEADIGAKKQVSDISIEKENSSNESNNAKVTKMDPNDIDGKLNGSNTELRSSEKKKGISIHPDAFANSGMDIDIINNVDNNNLKLESVPPVVKTQSKTESLLTDVEIKGDGNNVDVSTNNSRVSQDKNEKKKDKKKSKVKLKKSKIEPQPMDMTEDVSPSKASIDSIGSASDLKAITESYQKVLKADLSPSKYSEVYPGSAGKLTPSKETVVPEPSPGAGKLSPIQPKHLPPPLPHDMKSTSLRTTYKTDPSYTMSKFFGRSLSGVTEREKLHADTMSQRSFSTTTALHPLSTREARDRMKQGNIGAALLSSSELDRYFPDRKVGLWVGCWNMAEIKDCREPLDDFLLPEVSEYVQDIYAIGTQENAMSKKEWEILLQETLGPSHVLFHSASHGALHLAVFIKRDLIWFCTVPEDDLVQTRAVTMVKTKGAIAISFNFFGTSFLFINSHFTPGDGKKKDRLDDYSRIIKQLNLPKTGNTGSPNGSSHDITTRFDCVFWMGDLNFRIQVYKGKQAVEDIVQYIQEQEHPNFEDLVAGDQLTQLIVEGNIFQGFQEGRINFRPTYKFDIGKETYDTSAKNRIPSYTDRVLFRAKKKNSITCTHYESPTSIKVSDHRPVFALYEAAIKPARECTQPLAAGQFDRAVYTEANKRRSLKVDVVQKLQRKEKNSTVCSIQ